MAGSDIYRKQFLIMTEEEKYLHLYDTESVFQPDYNGSVYHEPWVSLTVENHKVNYNKRGVGNYFHWSNGNTNINQNIAATATTLGVSYTTNMSGLTVESAATYAWVTSCALSNPNGGGTFNITTQANTTMSARTATFNVKSGTTIVGTITITQKEKDYFLWSNSSTAITHNISATTTSTTVTYTTNMSGLTVETDVPYSWITSETLSNPNGNGNLSITLLTNTAAAARTGGIVIKNGATTVATLTLIQGRTTPYFYVGRTVASATTTACTIEADAVNSTGNTGYVWADSVFFDTNFTNAQLQALTLSCSPANLFSSSMTYINTNNMVSYDDPDGVRTHNFMHFGPACNSGGTRTLTVQVMQGSNVIAEITIEQKEIYFYWGDSGTDSATTTYVGTGSTTSTLSFRTDYHGNLRISGATSYSWIAPVSAMSNNNQFQVSVSANTTDSARAAMFYIKAPDFANRTIGQLMVVQGIANGIVEIVYLWNQEYWYHGNDVNDSYWRNPTGHSFQDAIFKVYANGQIVDTLYGSDVDVWWILNAKRDTAENWCILDPADIKTYGDPDYTDACWRNWAIIDHDTGMFTHPNCTTSNYSDMGAQIYARINYNSQQYDIVLCCIRYFGR